MSARAPMQSDDALVAAFKAAKVDDKFGFLQITIDMDRSTFLLAMQEPTSGETDSDWTKMKGQCQAKTHTYFITRDPMKKEMFLLIHFAPDLSPVKQRMIYASSRPTLKSALGAAAFSQDYFISSAEECAVARFVDVRTLHERIDFRSDQEIEAQETSHEAAAKSVQSQVMQKLPVDVEDSAKAAIAKYQENGTNSVILTLVDGKSITGEESKADTPDAIAAALPDKEPKYILFRYTKSSDSSQSTNVFGYYCPDKAERKLKFTYSTCKANLIDYCREMQMEFGAKVEFSSKDDITHQFLDYHVFPERVEKQVFKAPKPPGKRKGRRRKSGTFKLGDPDA